MQPLSSQAHLPENSGFADAIERTDGKAKAERTRARLQAAACRLLDERGARHLKVADICGQAGVAHGTFYVYFRDLRDLLAQTLTEFVDFMQATMRDAAKGAEDRGRSATAAYVAMFETNAGLMRCLVCPSDDLPEAAQAFQVLNRQWTTTVVDARLRRLAREGRADSVGRDEMLRRAYALGGMVDQYLAMLLFGRDDNLGAVSRDREAVVDTLNLIWERGLEP